MLFEALYIDPNKTGDDRVVILEPAVVDHTAAYFALRTNKYDEYPSMVVQVPDKEKLEEFNESVDTISKEKANSNIEVLYNSIVDLTERDSDLLIMWQQEPEKAEVIGRRGLHVKDLRFDKNTPIKTSKVDATIFPSVEDDGTLLFLYDHPNSNKVKGDDQIEYITNKNTSYGRWAFPISVNGIHTPWYDLLKAKKVIGMETISMTRKILPTESNMPVGMNPRNKGVWRFVIRNYRQRIRSYKDWLEQWAAAIIIYKRVCYKNTLKPFRTK